VKRLSKLVIAVDEILYILYVQDDLMLNFHICIWWWQ